MAVAQQPLPSHLIYYLKLEPTTFPWQKLKCVKIIEIATVIVSRFTKEKKSSDVFGAAAFSAASETKKVD